jgi:hypothetical protein
MAYMNYIILPLDSPLRRMYIRVTMNVRARIHGDRPVRLASMIPGELVKKLDRLAEKLTGEDPYGTKYTRTDALKRVIVDGLKANGIE